MKKLLIIVSIAVAGLFPASIQAFTSSGQNYVTVDSCKPTANGILVTRFGNNTPYKLSNATKDAGHGLRDYKFSCVSRTKYLVKWDEVILPPSDETHVCDKQKHVILIVNPELKPQIQNNLTQFENDLCADNYGVVEKVKQFENPTELRSYLQQSYATFTGVEGAIFVGDVPLPYQYITSVYTNPNIPSTSKEVISFQYYSDLDGYFGKSTSYVSPGGHIYSWDTHSGNTDWEIWVGLLPQHKGTLSANLINMYFEKNHTYRMNANQAHTFAVISEHFKPTSVSEYNYFYTALKTGEYSWGSLSNLSSSQAYLGDGTYGPSVADGFTAMTNGSTSFVVHEAHGTFYASGSINSTWVEDNVVTPYFYWGDGCSIGDITYDQNFLETILYSPTSNVVFAKGATNDAAGLGTNSNGSFGKNIAQSLSQGQNIGQAILSHVNTPLIYPWNLDKETKLATPVFLGDPTLTYTK